MFLWLDYVTWKCLHVLILIPVDPGSEEREEGQERGRSEDGSWNKEKPQAAWCQDVLQGKLFWGRKKEKGRCKPWTFPVICLDTVDGLKPCRLNILLRECSLSGLSFPSAFALFSQKLISAIHLAMVSATKFPIDSPAWFNLPLTVPSLCHLSLSSSVLFLFFFFSPCRLIFRLPHPDVRSQERCQSDHVKGTGNCQWWGWRALLRRRRQANLPRSQAKQLRNWNWRALLPRGNQPTQLL